MDSGCKVRDSSDYRGLVYASRTLSGKFAAQEVTRMPSSQKGVALLAYKRLRTFPFLPDHTNACSCQVLGKSMF